MPSTDHPSEPVRLVVPEPLHTARLTLRRWTDADAEVFERIFGEVSVHRYLYSEPVTADTLPDMFGRRLRPAEANHDADAIRLVVEVTATGAVVGEVVLALRSVEHRQGEIGYLLQPSAAGQGYATEAAAALLRLGFAAGLHRIVARADARNTASIAVMERLGLRREALLVQNEFVKGEWADEIVYAMLASEHDTT